VQIDRLMSRSQESNLLFVQSVHAQNQADEEPMPPKGTAFHHIPLAIRLSSCVLKASPTVSVVPSGVALDVPEQLPRVVPHLLRQNGSYRTKIMIHTART